MIGLFSGFTLVTIIITLLVIIIIASAISSSTPSNVATTRSLLSDETLSYTPAITAAANQYNIGEYVPLLLAICNQESRGQGTNIFQISGNPKPISVAESIDRGVKYFSELIDLVGKPAPIQDPDDNLSYLQLLLAIQCYNYGEGYYHWLDNRTSGYGMYYSKNTAIEYQQIMLQEYPNGYGDCDYVDHILQFWDPVTNTNKTTGSGSAAMVSVALTQLGNEGGYKYWSYMGFTTRVPWCAAFVTWCAEQCGYIDAGIMEYTALADPTFYINRNQYFHREAGYVPMPGDLVYIDWEDNNDIDHVGIVEKVEKGMLYTIEGNMSDSVMQRSYELHDTCIAGYACPTYTANK